MCGAKKACGRRRPRSLSWVARVRSTSLAVTRADPSFGLRASDFLRHSVIAHSSFIPPGMAPVGKSAAWSGVSFFCSLVFMDLDRLLVQDLSTAAAQVYCKPVMFFSCQAVCLSRYLAVPLSRYPSMFSYSTVSALVFCEPGMDSCGFSVA